ncbi:MAG: DNA internalization-related competence protein ComEC/Rec2 [Clostridia bacterium]|nr:DNA internalization-related competence protein ComEC/Rec2 [Clostridia bacterium]
MIRLAEGGRGMKRDWIFRPQPAHGGWRLWLVEAAGELWPWVCAETGIRWAQLWLRPALPLALAVLMGGLLAMHPVGRLIWLMIMIASGVILIWRNRGGLLIESAQRWQFWLLLIFFILGGIRLGWPFWLAEQYRRDHPSGLWSGEVTVERIISGGQTGSDWVTAVVSDSQGVQLALSGSGIHIQPQARLNVTGYLERPAGAANPGGFDRRDWLRRQGILQEIDIARGEVVVLQAGRVSRLVHWAEMLRQALETALVRMVGGERSALLAGLLIGASERMDKAQTYDFRQAGLSHLTAVSGANIAFWLTPLTGLVRRLKIRRIWRQIFLLLALVGFGFLTGWQVSVSRAIVVSALFLAGRLFHRRSDPLNALGLAVLVFGLVQPFALVSYSFWLSALATIGLLAGGPALAYHLAVRWPHVPPGWLEFAGTNLAVQILVLPVAAILSHQLTFIGLIANVPALFLVEWLTVVSLLVLLAGAGIGVLLAGVNLLPGVSLANDLVLSDFLAVPGRPVAIALDSLSAIARFFARLQWGRWPVAWLNVLLVTGMLGLFVPAVIRLSQRSKKRCQRLAFSVMALGLVLFTVKPLLLASDQVWFFSVGQGDATLIRTRTGQDILIDTGKPGTGWQVLLPALDALGIRQLDALVLTHGHLDHAGGAGELLTTGRIRRLVVSELEISENKTIGGQDNLTNKLIAQAEMQGVPWTTLSARQSLVLNQTDQLQVLASADLVPMATDTDDLNERALHFRLDLSGHSLLLMSDSTPVVEQALLTDPRIVDNEILKVAHHGSRTTTLATFLGQVQPDLAIISVGPNNYGHPAPELLARLTDSAIPYLRTDRQGAILVEQRQGRLYAQTYRKEDHG